MSNRIDRVYEYAHTHHQATRTPTNRDEDMDITIGNWTATVDRVRGSGLTEMEATYLLCVAQGMTHKEVGRETGRSPETVSKALKRAYHRLGASRAAAAVAKAQAQGWIRYVGCFALAVMLGLGSDDAMRRAGRVYRLARRQEQTIHA